MLRRGNSKLALEGIAALLKKHLAFALVVRLLVDSQQQAPCGFKDRIHLQSLPKVRGGAFLLACVVAQRCKLHQRMKHFIFQC